MVPNERPTVAEARLPVASGGHRRGRQEQQQEIQLPVPLEGGAHPIQLGLLLRRRRSTEAAISPPRSTIRSTLRPTPR
jgi:hypothetical protein